MSDEQLNDKFYKLISELRSQVIKIVIGAIFAGIVSMVAFYYSTTNSLANNAKEIEDLKAAKAASNEVAAIREDLKEMKEVQKEMFKYMLEKK